MSRQKIMRLFFCVILVTLLSCKENPPIPTNSQKIELQILSITENGKGTGYYFLKLNAKQDTSRILTMGIGDNEAQNLALSIKNIVPDYPLPLDLVVQVTQKLDFKISEVLIDRIENEVYTAKIFGHSDKKLVEFDARPTDAITLAIKLKCPIYISKNLMP